MTISTRAQIITRRTYNRPTNEEGTEFETWEDTVLRVVGHQAWLWERAKGAPLVGAELAELEELRQLMLDRKVSMSGRSLWLGGTEIAKRREASQFNCSFTHAKTVSDIVDILWLLLQGCGVGFKPIPGTLSGFARPINAVEIIRSSRTAKGGNPDNVETWDAENKHWTIQVGDSAEAWAKSVGKLMAGKYPAEILTLDFSQIRPAGGRLAGYGWISSGDEAIARAFAAISEIMSKRAGQLLKAIDILDIVNWLGTVLSSRRSAEIALYDYSDPEWLEFARAKNEYWVKNPQRAQSNNSLVFYDKPTQEDLRGVFQIMLDAGGSEPGFINGKLARDRAPWFAGVNPCAEILLGDKSFCNLTEIDLAKFQGDAHALHRAAKVIARANYRQTCVNFNDGILQDAWHQNNQFLRLCGVGVTGVVRSGMDAYDFKALRNIVVQGAYSMADELNSPRPKNVTTIKPSGTLSKIMDTTEGVHKPLGKYIFNNVNFSKHDPVIPLLRSSGYKVIDNPIDKDAVLVTFPVEWKDVQFDVVDGKHVNLESAVKQLERYKMMMDNYVEQNCSVTISYGVEEVDEIVQWLHQNWDSYVGVSFILRADPTKTAEDLGYLYLPQEVTTKEKFDAYVANLQPVSLESANTLEELRDDECATGACPIR
jgi:adenosylcobalamin-dependent ribonucleoside-triphosphate reductase